MAEMQNVRLWVIPSPNDASYSICVQMVDATGNPVATVSTIPISEGMNIRLHDVFQGIRMAHRFPNP